MKICLDINKNSKKTTFDTDDIILFDGKEWYFTTKQDIFKEFYETNKLNAEKMLETQRRVIKVEEDLVKYKASVSEQILSLTNLIEKLYGGNE